MSMDELLSRQVPQSLEAEQSVLGSMLIDERCVPDVIALLQPDEFYLQQNRDIFETIYTMFNFSQTIDPVTVLENMMAREGLAEDAVHRTVNEEKENKTEPTDGGIQLEL